MQARIGDHVKRQLTVTIDIARQPFSGCSIRPALLLAGLCSFISACQNQPQTLPTDDRFHIGLGVAQQSNPMTAEETLKKVLQEREANDNQQGIARTNWSLGELLKSPNYQSNIKPPQTTQAYLKSANYFVNSAKAYQSIGKRSMESSAYVGAANAYLLADKIKDACKAFNQAKSINAEEDAKKDKMAFDNMQRNITTFGAALVDACK